MKITKLALAGALGAFMFTAVHAAPAVAPASMGVKSTVQTVADKKAAPKKAAKKKAAKPAKKKVAKAGPGRCGTMMYYNKKTKKCTSKG